TGYVATETHVGRTLCRIRQDVTGTILGPCRQAALVTNDIGVAIRPVLHINQVVLEKLFPLCCQRQQAGDNAERAKLGERRPGYPHCGRHDVSPESVLRCCYLHGSDRWPFPRFTGKQLYRPSGAHSKKLPLRREGGMTAVR